MVILKPLKQLPDDCGSLSSGVNLALVRQANRKVKEDKGRKILDKNKRNREKCREDVTSLRFLPQSAIVVQMVLHNCTSAC